MLSISDSEFDSIIGQAMDELPPEYITGLNNVAIVYEDEPTPQQKEILKLRCDQVLFGLYEGIPMTKRGAGYTMVLPDKITIFKNSILAFSQDIASFKHHVKHTLWHEIAHFYGLDHDRIHGLEKKTI